MNLFNKRWPCLPRAAVVGAMGGCVESPCRHRSALKAGIMLGVLTLLPASAVMGQAVPAGGKSAVATSEIKTLIDQVRGHMLGSGRYSAKQVDAVAAKLQTRTMVQIREMAELKGSALKGAERLTGASGMDPNPSPSDRAGSLLGSSGVSARTGNASSLDALTSGPPGGGIVNRSGFASLNPGCEACPRTKSGQASGGAVHTLEPTGSPHTSKIGIYSDGSVRFTYTDGTHEYLNNRNELVDANAAPISNTTPRPDGAGPDGSTRVTMADVRRIGALRGRLGLPNPEKSGAGGGPVNTVRATPTATTGLFTEQAEATYVSDAEIAEILRVVMERLRGPAGP